MGASFTPYPVWAGRQGTQQKKNVFLQKAQNNFLDEEEHYGYQLGQRSLTNPARPTGTGSRDPTATQGCGVHGNLPPAVRQGARKKRRTSPHMIPMLFCGPALGSFATKKIKGGLGECLGSISGAEARMLSSPREQSPAGPLRLTFLDATQNSGQRFPYPGTERHAAWEGLREAFWRTESNCQVLRAGRASRENSFRKGSLGTISRKGSLSTISRKGAMVRVPLFSMNLRFTRRWERSTLWEGCQ